MSVMMMKGRRRVGKKQTQEEGWGNVEVFNWWIPSDDYLS